MRTACSCAEVAQFEQTPGCYTSSAAKSGSHSRSSGTRPSAVAAAALDPSCNSSLSSRSTEHCVLCREERKLPRSTRARARAEHDLEVLHSSGHELTQATKTLRNRQVDAIRLQVEVHVHGMCRSHRRVTLRPVTADGPNSSQECAAARPHTRRPSS